MSGVGPIPLTEIKAYLDMYGVTDLDERMYWIRMIKVLDRVYIEHINKTAQRKREKTGRRSRAPRR